MPTSRNRKILPIVAFSSWYPLQEQSDRAGDKYTKIQGKGGHTPTTSAGDWLAAQVWNKEVFVHAQVEWSKICYR